MFSFVDICLSDMVNGNPKENSPRQNLLCGKHNSAFHVNLDRTILVHNLKQQMRIILMYFYIKKL
jgi:hypothetical protein